MSTGTTTARNRVGTEALEQLNLRSDIHPVRFGFRALGVGMVLIACGAVILRWASLQHRTSGAATSPSTTEPIAGRVEGGI
jgi:hypothetical protein